MNISRRPLRLAFLLALTLITFSTQTGCKRNNPLSFNPAFAKYIAAYTSGQISIASSIKIQLTDALIKQINALQIPLQEVVTTSPRIEGAIQWVGGNTIELQPNAWLESNKKYQVNLTLEKFVDVATELEVFSFEFATRPQHVEMVVDQIVPYDANASDKLRLRGKIITNDVCAVSALPQVLEANCGGKELAIQWSAADALNTYTFVIDSIAKKEEAQEIRLAWDASAIGGNASGELLQRIPSKNEFNVFMHQVIQMPEQHVQLLFSSPLDPSQDLNGLIDITDCSNEKFIIENNEVRVYPATPQIGAKSVVVHAGIKGLNGLITKEEQIFPILFEDLKPNILLPSTERVILPSTDGLVFPFEAVNLSAVHVKVSKIYESNIPQFLQVNSLAGNDEMYRVAKVIKETTVQLNDGGDKDLSKWNTFYLNLNEIIRTEPGAIYNVELDFDQTQSLYRCAEKTPVLTTLTDANSEGEEGEDSEETDYDEGYDDYYDQEEWDYSRRNDPCSKAYYNYHYPIAKNILASDIGIIAKQWNEASMMFAVTDMRTALPLSGVTLDILDYQQQVIGSVKTDAQGIAEITTAKDKAFLVIAKLDSQRGYLKVSGGESLSTSTFDTGGIQSQKGLKGFIYGERGVWRPGDSLFVNFMLSDETGTLPANHPIQFELLNPKGQLVQKLVRTEGIGHLYNFTCQTSPDAITGVYTANVRVGGATFSKSLRIENVKPNRLKINFENPTVIINDNEGKASTKLHAQWLHGAIAKNLKTHVMINYSAAKTAFPNWKNYTFDDPIRSVYSEEKTLFDGRLNLEGDAQIPNKIELNDAAPGMINVNYLIKVFEESGDFSVDRFTCLFAPYNNFVGVKIPSPSNGYAHESGVPTTVEIASVNANGVPTKTENLTWKLYKVEWRYWWERNGDNLANYIGSESTIPVAQGITSTGANGKSTIQISVDKQSWGRYLLRVEDNEGGHATGQSLYFDWSDESSRANRKNNEGANYLSFTADKEKYNAGENCTITIPGAANANALITIESSTGVVRKEWVAMKGGENTYTFATDRSMAPNVYAHVSLIQPHGQTVNDMPIRMYGVIPIFVEFPESRITPEIAMPNELAPEQSFGIDIREKSGRGMSYTLAIVDEGLLDLTRHKTADPWNFFYSREALGVQTFDMYDQVIGALGTKIEKLLSLGGDGAVVDKNKQTANRFKPVVMFLGPFQLAPGASQHHQIQMPNYVGSVRVMVVAENAPAYGNAEKTVPVKKPLMVLSTLPRVLSLGEEVALPVTVFAMDKNIKDVKVRVESNDLLQVLGASQESITFSKVGDKIVNFKIKVGDKQGIGRVKVRVENSLGHTAYHEIEINVRNPNPFETKITDGIAEAGQSWRSNYSLHGTPGTNTAKIEVSSMPSLNLENQLAYLITYPHGCIEQTTSGAFPQLFLSDLIDLEEQEVDRVTHHINSAIRRLMQFTCYDGGFAYWPGEGNSDQWGTTYAGHFLLEAKNKGYAVPAGWETKWMAYQQRNAQAWNPSGSIWQNLDHVQQAYRLFTLALAGKPEWGAMSRLKAVPNLSVPAKWRLAATYALCGRKDEANGLIKNAPTAIANYRELSYTYGSNWRDLAMIIEALVLLEDKERVAPLLVELAQGLEKDNYYSTQTTAFSLLALSKHYGKQKSYAMDFIIKGNNGWTKKVNTASAVSVIQLPVDQVNNNQIELVNKGRGQLFCRIISKGQPAVQNESLTHNKIYTEIEYLDMQGNKLNVSNLEQGTEFYAQVRVWNSGERGELKEIALEQVFAGGWEIGNQRMDGMALAKNISLPEYQDIKDDRVFSYFDLYTNETRIYRIRLTAAYAGQFYLPGLKCGPMYDESVVSKQLGQWVTVTAPSVASKQ